MTNRLTWMLFALVACAYALRLWFISGNNVLFWFDQARDATVVQEMVEQRDIKLQGPSASGTNDTVYHGVLYYYVIAPLYAVFDGNPTSVAAGLGLINSLTVIPLFFLLYSFTRSLRYSFLGSLLFVFSFEQTELGTWLSNPTLAVPSILLFFYFLWRVFWQKRSNELVGVALFLGISNQAIIFTIYLVAAAGVALLLQWWQERTWLFSWKQLLLSVVVYLVTVSTILLNQFLLWKNGIFTFKAVRSGSSSQALELSSLPSLFQNYLEKFENAFFPGLPLLALICLITLLVLFFVQRGQRDRKIFLALWILSPLFLLLFQFRGSYHTFTGITPAFYLLCILVLHSLQFRWKHLVEVGFFTFFILWNVSQLSVAKAKGSHVAQTHDGSDLQQKLKVVDHTYKVANGQEFSLSTVTWPYGYNTTWAYLYDWYGQQKYGYTPTWFGPSQEGIFGGNKLASTPEPKELHFSLYEHKRDIVDIFLQAFTAEQIRAGEVVESREFGKFTLEQR